MTDDLSRVNNASSTEPEISVIPEKYYGAALRASVQETVSAPISAPVSHTRSIVIGIVVAVFLLGIGGTFLYVNRGMFAPPSKPIVQAPLPPPVPVVVIPTPPSNLSATSTNPQSASLSWSDLSENETGFRVERADDAGGFHPVTSLPAGSAVFIDSTVVSGRTIRYRVIAVNSAGDSPSSNEVSVAIPSPAPIVEAPKLPPAGLDSDSDGISDLEEALYGTNPHMADTDGDGFLDGNEVFHLYNPGGRAPGKLLDAKLVTESRSDVGWSMYVPVSWTMTIGTNGLSAVIATGHAESFSVAIEDNIQALSIIDWYKQKNPTVPENQIYEYVTKKGYKGITGPDLLTTYIPWGSKVFVFTYLLNGQPFINYRTTYAMMMNSLLLNGLPQVSASVMAQTALPFEPSANATGTVNEPVLIAPFPEPSPTATSVQAMIVPTASPGSSATTTP